MHTEQYTETLLSEMLLIFSLYLLDLISLAASQLPAEHCTVHVAKTAAK